MRCKHMSESNTIIHEGYQLQNTKQQGIFLQKCFSIALVFVFVCFGVCILHVFVARLAVCCMFVPDSHSKNQTRAHPFIKLSKIQQGFLMEVLSIVAGNRLKTFYIPTK
ncbi:hypothetical protein ILYODFUR_035394 [Ilyodon furcidens]|uniref:Transmembrane protein n=1 Tax=Ilyodon furcidens TaxID=33524 RepID=A0ABV0TPJ2_9TELE